MADERAQARARTLAFLRNVLEEDGIPIVSLYEIIGEYLFAQHPDSFDAWMKSDPPRLIPYIDARLLTSMGPFNDDVLVESDPVALHRYICIKWTTNKMPIDSETMRMMWINSRITAHGMLNLARFHAVILSPKALEILVNEKTLPGITNDPNIRLMPIDAYRRLVPPALGLLMEYHPHWLSLLPPLTSRSSDRLAAILVMFDISNAVSVIHRCGAVHRDLSTMTVMLSNRQTYTGVCLSHLRFHVHRATGVPKHDFVLSTQQHAACVMPQKIRSFQPWEVIYVNSLTHALQTCKQTVKDNYAGVSTNVVSAPNELLYFASDVFSLGCIFFAMLIGTNPWKCLNGHAPLFDAMIRLNVHRWASWARKDDPTAFAVEGGQMWPVPSKYRDQQPTMALLHLGLVGKDLSTVIPDSMPTWLSPFASVPIEKLMSIPAVLLLLIDACFEVDPACRPTVPQLMSILQTNPEAGGKQWPLISDACHRYWCSIRYPAIVRLYSDFRSDPEKVLARERPQISALSV